ncbi:MAG: hypothetical protein AAGM38_13100 [Pseudomonadota bacterium]
MISRLVEWWHRTRWGWLVILGPVIVYLSLLVSLDLVGLAADGDPYFREVDPRTAFRSGIERDLASMSGRMEFALASVLYFLVAIFSIIWALPRILGRYRNPFGGLLGVLIAGAMVGFLYFLYLISDYNIRIAFADDVLRLGEDAGAVDLVTVRFWPFGMALYEEVMPQSQMLASIHAIVYLIGGAAPWVLVVFMANIASFEPRSLGKESHKALRMRMVNLQIALALAALNIVLSVYYLHTMMGWPLRLFEDELAASFLAAATRYSALFGVLGTLMLLSTLAPAYLALNRQYDLVAEHELMKAGDDYVSYEERIAWRRKHGLLLSAQQAVTAGVAVVAPLITSPALPTADTDGPPPSRFEQQLRQAR